MELPEVELKLCAVGGVEADERNTEAEKGLRVPFGVEVVEASVTISSKSWFPSGTKVLSKEHLYRPESDCFSCVMLTYIISDEVTPLFSYLMLYLPF